MIFDDCVYFCLCDLCIIYYICFNGDIFNVLLIEAQTQNSASLWIYKFIDAATGSPTFNSRYLGCYIDSRSRTLDSLYSSDADSVTLCTSFCYENGKDLNNIHY